MPYNEVYPRMVYRVIALYKERKFSAQEWRALCYLWGHSESNTPSGIDYPTMGIYAIYTAAGMDAGFENDTTHHLFAKASSSLFPYALNVGD